MSIQNHSFHSDLFSKAAFCSQFRGFSPLWNSALPDWEGPLCPSRGPYIGALVPPGNCTFRHDDLLVEGSAYLRKPKARMVKATMEMIRNKFDRNGGLYRRCRTPPHISSVITPTPRSGHIVLAGQRVRFWMVRMSLPTVSISDVVVTYPGKVSPWAHT